MPEPSEEVKRLQAEALASYEQHHSSENQAEARHRSAMSTLAAQRGGAIRWSNPPEAKPDDRDAK